MLDSIVSFIITVGSLPPRILLTFLGTLVVLVALVVSLIRFSGVRKLSLTEGVEFEDDGVTPKKPTARARRVAKPKVRKTSKK